MINIYIAGKITSEPNYKEHFKKAQDLLDKKGFITCNPADSNLNFDLGYEKIMHICYAMIDICEGVYFLDNWQHSTGAQLEYKYAVDNGKFLMFEKPEIIKQFKSLEEIKAHYDYIDKIMAKARN